MAARQIPVARGWLSVAAPLLLIGLAMSPGSCESGGRGGSDDPPEAALVELFKSEGVVWIRALRERHRPRAMPFSEEDRSRFGEYFPERVLDRARLRVVEGFANPGFFSVFENSGEPYPVDLRQASAVALVDTILVARRASESSVRDRLLFHELVHMVQYEVLGLEAYMERYVDSWARNDRRYRDIAHERQAFELAARFWRSAGEAFSVEAEVRARFGVGTGVASPK